MESLAEDAKSVPRFRCYASPPPTEICALLNLLANVKQKTIEPFIKDTIVPGTCVYTDEYSIYARLSAWGVAPHLTVVAAPSRNQALERL